MSKFKLFFTGDDGDYCMAENLSWEGVMPVGNVCENPATYFAEDEDGEQTALCDVHKDVVKELGLAS